MEVLKEAKKQRQRFFIKLHKIYVFLPLKLSCDSRFQRAFTACVCAFKVITLISSNQRNFFENANACSKRILKTTVATQLKDCSR